MAGNHLVILIQGLTKYYTELQPAETETQHLIQSSARLATTINLKLTIDTFGFIVWLKTVWKIRS